MKQKTIFFIGLLALSLLGLWAFKSKTSTAAGTTAFMQVTTIESIIPGGLGRSRMLVTDEKGSTTETDMDNFYSLVGINFGNIKKNEAQIIAKINAMTADGWVLDQVTAGTQSPSQGFEQGIYMTRYLFRKEK